MQLKKLVLKQIGRHALLTCDLNAPVAGLLGPNGVGKTTILRSIRYAMTGDFGADGEDGRVSANVFMRDGGKHGTGEIELEFEKQGKIGKITRRITKTSTTRSLEWDGKTLTSAKDVDATMRDILNADKRSVMDCVFIKQGHTDDVLFGTETERERSFLRMVGCAHLDLVAKAAASQAAILRSTCQDNAPAMLDLGIQLEGKNSRFREISGELAGCPDQSITITSLKQQVILLQDVMTREAILTNAQTTLQQVQGNNVLATTQLADLGVDRARKAIYATTLQNEWGTIWDSLGKQERLQGDALAFKHQLDVLTAAEAVKIPEDQSEELERRRTQYAEKAKRQASLKDTCAAEEQRANHQRVIQEGEPELRKYQDVKDEADMKADELTRELDTLQANKEVQLWYMTVDVLNRIASTDCALESCPVCKSSLVHWSKDEAQQQRTELLDKLTAHKDKLKKTIDERDKWRMGATRANLKITEISQQLTLARALLGDRPFDPSDFSIARGQLETLEAEMAAEAKAGQTIGAGQQQRAELLKRLHEVQGAFAKWRERPDFKDLLAFNVGNSAITIENLKQQQRENEAAQQANRNELEQLARRIQQLEQAVQAEAIAQNSLRNAMAHITFQGTQQSISADLETRQTQQAAREQLLSVQREVQRDITSLTARQGELEILQRANLKKILAAEHMDLLAKVFGREGITRDYLDDLYGRLMFVVGPHLTRMNANFMVRKGPGVLNFEFQRIDEPSEWMQQSQLSGGQRVKMAVAFLLALQQIIIPDVGLLVLDEPTTHLDAASREGFRDMLEDLQAVLQRTECQVIVCDHCVEILPALQKKVELTI